MGKKVEKELEIMKFRDRPQVITKVVYRNNPNALIYYTLAFMAGVLTTLAAFNIAVIL